MFVIRIINGKKRGAIFWLLDSCSLYAINAFLIRKVFISYLGKFFWFFGNLHTSNIDKSCWHKSWIIKYEIRINHSTIQICDQKTWCRTIWIILWYDTVGIPKVDPHEWSGKTKLNKWIKHSIRKSHGVSDLRHKIWDVWRWCCHCLKAREGKC